jgi:hypothetical protein
MGLNIEELVTERGLKLLIARNSSYHSYSGKGGPPLFAEDRRGNLERRGWRGRRERREAGCRKIFESKKAETV